MYRLLAVATVLVAAQAALAATAGHYTHDSMQSLIDVLPLVMSIAVPAAIGGLLIVTSGDALTGRGAVAILIATGALMRAVWFGAPAPIEDDFYRYLWDGAVTAQLGNPHRLSPSDVIDGRHLTESVAALREQALPTLQRINFPTLTSIYPGVAQLAFALAHRIAPWQLDGLRAVFILADIATLVVLLAWLNRLGRPLALSSLYWCNPLVVLATTATAHVDALLPPLVAGSMLAMAARRPGLGGALLGLAAGVKIWPVLLVPLMARWIGAYPKQLMRAGAGFAIIVALSLAPVVLATQAGRSGLVAYSQGWHMNNAPYAWASYGLYLLFGENASPQIALRAAAGLATVATALWVALHDCRTEEERLRRALAVTAVLFFLSPAQFPWYALWFLPFAVVVKSWPLLATCALLPAYYFFFPLANAGARDVFQYGFAFLHTIPVALWLMWRWSRRNRI